MHNALATFSLALALQRAEALDVDDESTEHTVEEGHTRGKRKVDELDDYSEGEIIEGEYQSRAGKRKARKKDRTRKKKEAQKARAFVDNDPTRGSAKALDMAKQAATAEGRVDVTKLPVDASGYQSLSKGAHQKGVKLLNLTDLLGEDYELVPWNAKCVSYR